MPDKQSEEFSFKDLTRLFKITFDIDENEINPSTLLSEDLEIDYLDICDLIVYLKTFTEKKFTPSNFEGVYTAQDIVDMVNKVS